jgi:uncharacterized membrane protein
MNPSPPPFQPEQPPTVEYPRNLRKKDIDLNVIGRSWDIIKRNPWPFVMCGLLMLVPQFVLVGIVYWMMLAELMASGPESMLFSFAFSGMMMVIPLATALISGPAWGSITYMTLKEHDGEAAEMEDIWHGFRENAWRHIGMYVLYNIGVVAGSMCCYIPGFILGGLWLGSSAYIVEKELPVIDAMRASFNDLKPYWIMAGVFYFLISLLMGAGFIVCGFGVLVTWPMAYMAMALVYRDLSDPGPPVSYPGVDYGDMAQPPR